MYTKEKVTEQVSVEIREKLDFLELCGRKHIKHRAHRVQKKGRGNGTFWDFLRKEEKVEDHKRKERRKVETSIK